VVWKSVSLSLSLSFASIFCLLDSVRDLDHQVSIRETGIVCSNFGHGIIGCLFDFLFMPVLDVLMQRTTFLSDFAEVLIIGDVLGADITRHILVGYSAV